MPALDEMVAAATGLGCRWNGRAARVSTDRRLEDAVLLCTSFGSATVRSDAYERLQKLTKIQPAGATVTATSSSRPGAPTSCSTRG